LEGAGGNSEVPIQLGYGTATQTSPSADLWWWGDVSGSSLVISAMPWIAPTDRLRVSAPLAWILSGLLINQFIAAVAVSYRITESFDVSTWLSTAGIHLGVTARL